jgi:hypothetical protein
MSDAFVRKTATCVHGHTWCEVARKSSPLTCPKCSGPPSFVRTDHTIASLDVRLLELEGRVKALEKDPRTQPCDPANACTTHGRCWTHSEWTDGEVTMRPLSVEQRKQAEEALSLMREAAEATSTVAELRAEIAVLKAASERDTNRRIELLAEIDALKETLEQTQDDVKDRDWKLVELRKRNRLEERNANPQNS